MKRNLLLFSLLFALLCDGMAQGPKHEFRASWVATVWGIDWPHGSTATVQKAELDAILNKAKAGNMTAVMFQVRGYSDALYHSTKGEPWSSVLTGTRGNAPSYDPLQYAIDGAHARGLELHVWINPYRVGNYTNISSQIQSSWILGSGSSRILDPGNPAARQYVLSVIEDIVDHYDIDGIIFDDYFYKDVPASSAATGETTRTAANNPHNLSLQDWRRENVNLFVQSVMQMVQTKKPYLRFGIGPAGVWSTSAHKVYNADYTQYDNVSACPGTWDVYSDLYCDGAAWLKRGIIDYIAPQLYWPMLSTETGYVRSSSFDKICPWWANVAHQYGRHFYVSQDVAKNTSNGSVTRFNSMDEVAAEMNYLRANGKVEGSIFYNTQFFLNLNNCNSYFSSSSEGVHTFLAQSWYQNKCLAPVISWRNAPTLAAPTHLAVSGHTLSWTHANAPRFTVYAFPKGMDATTAIEDPAYLLGITYSPSFDISSVSNLDNTTLAVCAYDRYGNEYAPALYNAGESSLENGEVRMNAVWKKTAAAVPYLGTTNSNRSMAYYAGNLFIPNVENGTFAIIDDATGELVMNKSIDDAAFWQHNLRITQDGQMLLGNSSATTAKMQVWTSSVANGGAEGPTTYSLSGLGRTDYFYPMGNWNGTGKLIALSNTGKLLKINISNGSLGAETVTTNAALPTGTSAKAIPADANSFYASVADELPTRHALTTGNKIDEFGANLGLESAGVSGLGAFSIRGHSYIALPRDAYGSFAIYETTYGMSNAQEVVAATAPLGSNNNATFTIDFCTVVRGDTCLIYVLAPNNGIASYQFIFTPEQTPEPPTPEAAVNATEQNVFIRPTMDGVAIGFEGTQEITIYAINGALLTSQRATENYTYPLAKGAYLIQVGNSVHKFVK